MSPAPTKGPVSQRELCGTIIALVDAARAANSTAHKDIARSKLRALLTDPTVNWRTPFLAHNIGVHRARFLNSIGLWTPSSWTQPGWKGDPIRTDHGEIEE